MNNINILSNNTLPQQQMMLCSRVDGGTLHTLVDSVLFARKKNHWFYLGWEGILQNGLMDLIGTVSTLIAVQFQAFSSSLFAMWLYLTSSNKNKCTFSHKRLFNFSCFKVQKIDIFINYVWNRLKFGIAGLYYIFFYRYKATNT